MWLTDKTSPFVEMCSRFWKWGMGVLTGLLDFLRRFQDRFRRPIQVSYVFANARHALADYLSTATRTAFKSWKKLSRRLVRSSAVSKEGHLFFLVPRHRQVCLETAAKDQVIHFEVITLAKEQEAPREDAVGQILVFGGRSRKRERKRIGSRFLNPAALPIYR
jgi:hypothetical protein